MRYSEIVESYYRGKKQELLDQIKPGLGGGYNYDDELRPRLTLRLLKKIRLLNDKEKQERNEYMEFLPTMYGVRSALTTDQWLELEKNRQDNATDLEIERLRAGDSNKE